MKLYAVAVLSFFDNEILLEFIHAENELMAITQHSQFISSDVDAQRTMEDWAQQAPQWVGDGEEIKNYFYQGELAIEVKEVPCTSN